MAERRMFAKAVVNSARFLRMPQTSRLLYYDLGVAADDDGVVEAFTVIRTTGAAEDDLRVLASRGFIQVLNEDLVTYITDWKKNNLIRPDRYHPSVYAELLVKISDGGNGYTDGLPMVDERETQVSIGEGSIGKESAVVADKPPKRPRFRPPSVEEVRAYCTGRGNKIDPEQFVSYYESVGWKIGKNPMRSWKSAIITWEKREGGQHGDIGKRTGANGEGVDGTWNGYKLDSVVL